jgi:hypothetical protein
VPQNYSESIVIQAEINFQFSLDLSTIATFISIPEYNATYGDWVSVQGRSDCGLAFVRFFASDRFVLFFLLLVTQNVYFFIFLFVLILLFLEPHQMNKVA